MKTNKNVGRYVSVVLFMAAFFMAGSLAQAVDQPVLPLPKWSANPTPAELEASEANAAAMLGIQDFKIVSQSGNEFKISFNIENTKGVQPQVIYQLRLQARDEKGASYIIDQKTYDEVLSLTEGEKVQKEIEYAAPPFLKGKFDLWINAQNLNGIMFSMHLIPNVELSGSGEYVELNPQSCYLNVEGEGDKKYVLPQGVDVERGEVLKINCVAKNNFSRKITITPQIQTFRRLSSGKKVDEKFLESISFEAGEQRNIQLTFPKVETPQAYDAVLSFANTEKQTVSNKITAHYIVRGVSGTIQLLSFDKDYYAKGETANVSIFWSPSADNFYGSRAKVSRGEEEVSLDVVITNSNGIQCGTFGRRAKSGETTVKAPIVMLADCLNPKAMLTIKDASGNVLDQGEFLVKSKSIPAEEQGRTQTGEQTGVDAGKNWTRQIAFGVAGLLVLLGLVSVYVYRKRSNSTFPLFLILGASLVLFCNVATVSAATEVTFNVGDRIVTRTHDNWATNWYYAGLNAAVYDPGEAGYVTGYGWEGYCTNGYNVRELYINGSLVLGNWMGSWGNGVDTGYYSFNASATPGQHCFPVVGKGSCSGWLNCWSSTYYVCYRTRGCGDGVCGGGETCNSCSTDCGACSCTGGDPANAQVCSGDNTGLTSDFAKTLPAAGCSAPAGSAPKCEYECKLGFRYDPASKTCKTTCGDSVVDAGEVCDVGKQNGVKCTPTYGQACTYCKANCTEGTVAATEYCSDGKVNGPEQCDDGNTDPETKQTKATAQTKRNACAAKLGSNTKTFDFCGCWRGVWTNANQCPADCLAKLDYLLTLNFPIHNPCSQNNGPCPHRCSDACKTNVCEPCNNGIVYQSSSVVPDHVSVGESYAIKCNYGVSSSDAIAASSAGGACSAAGFSGNDAVFNCTAGSVSGTFSNWCKVISETSENRCAKDTEISPIIVSQCTISADNLAHARACKSTSDTNDEAGLQINTPYALKDNCSEIKCEYVCESGYHRKQSGTTWFCERDCLESCTAKPGAMCSRSCGTGTKAATCRNTRCEEYDGTVNCNTQACPPGWIETKP